MLNPQSSESVSCPELTHLPELKQGQLFFLLRLKKKIKLTRSLIKLTKDYRG